MTNKALFINETIKTAFLINLISEVDVSNPIIFAILMNTNLNTKLIIERSIPIRVFQIES